MDTTNKPSTSKDASSYTQITERKINARKAKIADPAIEALKSMKDAVRSELINCEPGDELETLIRTLQLDVLQASQVKEDVLAAFQDYYRGIFKESQLHLYGSVVMGLAFKDSDLDFYVELPNSEHSKNKRRWLKKIRDILEVTNKFTRFESFKLPRVICTHIGTLTNCDFNCSNQFGNLNSPIVAHLLNFDPRICKLAIIIKYWMKIHDCAGMNLISSYGVVWMLIFYLQTLPKPIVPPIDDFQRNVPPSMASDCNFTFDFSMQNETENQSQWPELLLGFFRFYRDFDYDSQLICPLYGKTFSKLDVMEKRVIELQRYADHNEKTMLLDYKSLCIQDPFEIIRNIPGDISVNEFRKIISKIGYAAEIIECELQKGETKSMFLRLFDVSEFDQKIQLNVQQQNIEQHQHRSIVEQQRNQLNNAKRMKWIASVFPAIEQKRKIKYHLKPTNFILDRSQYDVWQILTNNSDAQIDEHSIRKIWAKEVIEMIVVILRDIFCLDFCADENSDEFHLKGAHDVFEGRRKKKISAKTWNEEALDSSNLFGRTPYIPFETSGRITADIVNFDYVSIEFNDEIRTKKNNFYGKFRTIFSYRIGYFLTIYFLHRTEMAKSKIANVNQATAQQESTLSILQIDSQNSTSLKIVLQLKPTEFAMSLVRGILLKDGECSYGDAKSEELKLKQLWAQKVIKMIADILSDIFKLELHTETSQPYLHIFNLTGLWDKSNPIFLRRKKKESIVADTWSDEMLDSLNRFNSTSSLCVVPLKLSAKITADAENCNYVFIEFNDEIKIGKQNLYRTFCREFILRIDYFLNIYFLYCNEMGTLAAVNANPAEVKTATKSSTQQTSASTLPSTPIVSENTQNLTKRIILTPTEPMLYIISDILSKPVSDADKGAVKQFWADNVIEFMIQILSDIFKLQLLNLKLDRFKKTFDVIGTCDVFIERKQKWPINDNTLNLELQESLYRSVCFSKPLALFVTIATDVRNFDSVSIELSDRIRTETDNFYETFYQQLRGNIVYLLQVYFVHRYLSE